jgi:hypothetical protein
MVDDPKVQRLPDALFKALINLWCLASKNDGTLPPADEIGFKLRMKPEKVATMLTTLLDKGLLDEFETALRPHNWRNRQYKSDVSTDRVKQFRKRLGNVSRPVSVTRPDTETERLLSSSEQEPALRKVNGQARGASREAVPLLPTSELVEKLRTARA